MIGYWNHPLVRLSVRLSVTLCIIARCTRLKLVPARSSRQVPICPFKHFCCRKYRLATKSTEKNRVEDNANVSFLRQTIRHALVVLRSVIHGLSELLNFGLLRSMVTLE